MPRRKRKSSFQNKPSLLFTESPVSIVNNVPSPVMCARYPPTATSVPVEDLEELAWVSPQFTRVPSTGNGFGRRRPPKHRKTNATTSLHNKENTLHQSHHGGPRKTKFTSLKFIGEKTVEESTAEDVNISYESVSHSDVEPGNDARISEQDSPANVANDGDTANNQSKAGSHRRHKQKRFSERLSRINFLNDDANHSNLVNHSTVINNEDNHESNSTQDDSSDLDLTKLRPKTRMRSPVVQLFQSQIHSCDIDKNIELTDDNDLMSTIPTDPDTEGGEVETVKETDTSSDCISDIDRVPNSDSDLDPGMTSTPAGVRRSLRIKMLRKMFEHGISPDKERDYRVIVPDTPENNHGWPLKKYQIYKYKLNKR